MVARELLDFDVATTPLIVEHEYPLARVQDKDALAPILKGSIAFTRYIDQAAAAMYSLQNEALAAQGSRSRESAARPIARSAPERTPTS